MTINSATALRLIKSSDAAQVIEEPRTKLLGYGFDYDDYKKWMMKRGFRTDTPKCVAKRWIETWIACGEIVKINTFVYFFVEIDGNIMRQIRTHTNADFTSVYCDYESHGMMSYNILGQAMKDAYGGTI